jgi:dolichol-phosphate mannosyltransferase
VLAVAALVGITAISCIKLFTDLAEPMWSSIMTVVFFSSSVQFFLIGLLGEYTARIYSEVEHRPHFIVRKRY